MWPGLITAVVMMLMYLPLKPIKQFCQWYSVNDVKLCVTPLQYIDVVIDNVKCKGLCDSGAQIPMINKHLVGSNAGSLEAVHIQGIVEIPCKPNLCH